MQEAITKLRTEMEGNSNNHYLQIVGDFLIRHITIHPEDAIKVMTADKTIAKSLTAMQSEARKKQVGGMAMLTDAEGFAVVLKYFGISGDPVTAVPATPIVNTPAPKATPAFNISFEEFLL